MHFYKSSTWRKNMKKVDVVKKDLSNLRLFICLFLVMFIFLLLNAFWKQVKLKAMSCNPSWCKNIFFETQISSMS